MSRFFDSFRGAAVTTFLRLLLRSTLSLSLACWLFSFFLLFSALQFFSEGRYGTVRDGDGGRGGRVAKRGTEEGGARLGSPWKSRAAELVAATAFATRLFVAVPPATFLVRAPEIAPNPQSYISSNNANNVYSDICVIFHIPDKIMGERAKGQFELGVRVRP